MDQISTARRSRRDHVADILTTAILRALAGRGARRPADADLAGEATTEPAAPSEQAQPAEAA